MLVAVDFEAIASRTHSPGVAHALNEAFDLGLLEAQLEALHTLDELEKVPVVRALFEQAEKNRALSQRLETVIEAAWEDQDSTLLQRSALPMRHAATALSWLAQSHALHYLTWRVPQAQDVTSQWLLLHGFPCPTQVTICQEMMEPFQAALHNARAGESIVLITSSSEAMIDAFLLLPPKQRERSFLVAFRSPQTFRIESENEAPFSLFALPSWTKEHVTDLFAEIDGYQHFQRLLCAG